MAEPKQELGFAGLLSVGHRDQERAARFDSRTM